MLVSVAHDKDKLKAVFEKGINIVCILCLTGMLLFLCDMQNELYGTLKDICYVRALLMLTIFMFITQKVRLFNWQSAVATIVYLPFGYAYGTRYSMAPDLYNKDKVVVWIIWIAILIAVDMIIYRKINSIKKFNIASLTVFALMSILMFYLESGQSVLLLIFLFYLIPLSKKDWLNITNQFCHAWLLAFFVVLYRSLKENPALDTESGIGRWYGCFVNIGDFGLFMACVAAAILYLLYRTRKEKGRKSFAYVLYFICLFPILWTVLRISTLTMLIGIGLIFLMGFLIIMKNCSAKKVVIRLIISSCGLLLLALLGFLAIKALANTDAEYWDHILTSENIFLKPIASIARRAHYMFDEAKTFADSGIFEPNSFINYLDLFTSGRLSIIKTFAEDFNFFGNSSNGYMVGTYFAYNTHNTYAQMIFNYGYIGGGAFLLWLFYSTIASVVQYVKRQDTFRVLTCIWMAMTCGVLLGESIGLGSHTLLTALFLTYPVMIKLEDAPANV